MIYLPMQCNLHKWNLLFCRNGFEPERIEAILHMIELGQKHQSTSFGLGIVAVSIEISAKDGLLMCLLFVCYTVFYSVSVLF